MASDCVRVRPRLVVFGVDGGCWRALDDLLEAGELPAFEALLEGGSRAVLPSVDPPLTAPAWMSIFTGLEPARHGVFDMTVYDRRLARRRPPSALDWPADTLWRRVEEMGLRGGYIGIPFTYPAPQVDGWFVSGVMGTPSAGPRSAHPEGLAEELRDVAGERPLEALEKRAGDYPLDALERGIEWLHTATMHLLATRPVDVLVVVENYTDFVQHFFATDPELHRPGGSTDMLRLAYRGADRLLGAIREYVGESVPVALVSDHGYAPLACCINATELKLRLAGEDEGAARAAEARFRTLKKLWRSTAKALLVKLGADPTRLSQWGVRTLGRSGDEAASVLIGHYGGTWLTGDPSATSPEAIERAAATLGAVRDPATNEPLLRVERGREIYAGPFADQAPHLILRPQCTGCEVRSAPPTAPLVVCPEDGEAWDVERGTTDGTHAPEGIWAMSAAGGELPQPRGLPDVMAVLLECLRHEAVAPAPGAESEPPPNGYTPEEEEAVLRQLQDLGYID